MAVLPILTHPNEILSQPTELVTDFGYDHTILANDLLDTIRATKNATSLSAPQVGKPVSMFVIRDLPGILNMTMVIVNPTIIHFSKDYVVNEEGCSSVPGIFANVTRAETIDIQAQDIEGKWFDFRAMGVVASIVQHELDHLVGKTILDKVPFIQRQLLKHKYKTLQDDIVIKKQRV